jgi:acyl dehydratase
MLYFEDLDIGRRESSKPTQLTEAEIIEFASRYDPQPYHVDKREAERSVFGGLTASSCHVISVAFSLFHDLPKIAMLAGLGHEFRYPNPVRPGQAFRLISEVAEKRESRSKPDRGIAIQQSRLVTDEGAVVLEIKSTVMVAKRG